MKAILDLLKYSYNELVKTTIESFTQAVVKSGIEIIDLHITCGVKQLNTLEVTICFETPTEDEDFNLFYYGEFEIKIERLLKDYDLECEYTTNDIISWYESNI